MHNNMQNKEIRYSNRLLSHIHATQIQTGTLDLPQIEKK